MNYKLFLKILFSTFFLSFSVALISNWKIDYNSLIGFISYFYFSLFWFKRFNTKIKDESILFYLILTKLLISIDALFSYFNSSLFSLPLILLHLLGIISSYFYLKIKSKLNVLPLLICSIFVVFMFYSGWKYWIHKLNYGTFTGRVSAYSFTTKFEGFDKQNNLTTNKDFKNKIVLLDFWQTTCGLCFSKFPQLQRIDDLYKNNSDVKILAVNIPIKEDKPKQAFDMIARRKYTFPVLLAKDTQLDENFGITGYPTTFVINQKGQVVYKGDIEMAIKMVDELKTYE